MQKEPKFKNGDIVKLDPTGRGNGATGKIIGIVHMIDGGFCYFVATYTFGADAVARHVLNECELMLKEEVD